MPAGNGTHSQVDSSTVGSAYTNSMHRRTTTTLTAAFLMVLLANSAMAELPPSDSAIFVEDMEGWGAQVTAELRRQNVPVQLTENPGEAQYIFRGGFDGRGALEVVDSKDGTVVWTERSGRWSSSASRGLVKKLRKVMWATVRSLPKGKSTRLILFKSKASLRVRKIKGVFQSATQSSVTILLRSGETRTVDRQAVQVVRVSRPTRRRYGWIPGAATFAVMVAIVVSGPSFRDFTPSSRAGQPVVVSAPAWLLGYLLMPSTRVVYRADKASGP